MITHESLIVRATVKTLKSVCDKSQSVLRSYILSSTKRKACSELSAVVDEPTIIPAAFVPLPATLFALLVFPPSVPKSVTVKFGWPLAKVNPMRKTNVATNRIIVFMGRGVLLRPTNN